MEQETTGARARAVTAVGALFDAHYLRHVRLATLLIGDQVAAEDIVQDAFAQVVRRWADIDEPTGYLRVAVVHGCMSWGRAQTRQRRLPAPHEAVGEGASADAIAVRDALANLPQQQRACVVLRYYGGFTEADVAGVLGCSVGTVKSRVHRALAHLRKELA